MVSVICKNCDKEIVDYPSNKRVTCSKKCHYAVIGQKLSKLKKGVKRPDMKNPYWLRKEGPEHPMFSNTPSYNAIHNYMRVRVPKPKTCLHCGEEKPLELANISQQYTREVNDWMYLCKSCHRRYDSKNVCKKGHPFTEGSYYERDNSRVCKQCRSDYSREYKAKFKQRYAPDPIKYLGENCGD